MRRPALLPWVLTVRAKQQHSPGPTWVWYSDMVRSPSSMVAMAAQPSGLRHVCVIGPSGCSRRGRRGPGIEMASGAINTGVP